MLSVKQIKQGFRRPCRAGFTVEDIFQLTKIDR